MPWHERIATIALAVVLSVAGIWVCANLWVDAPRQATCNCFCTGPKGKTTQVF